MVSALLALVQALPSCCFLTSCFMVVRRFLFPELSFKVIVVEEEFLVVYEKAKAEVMDFRRPEPSRFSFLPLLLLSEVSWFFGGVGLKGLGGTDCRGTEALCFCPLVLLELPSDSAVTLQMPLEVTEDIGCGLASRPLEKFKTLELTCGF